MRSSEIPQPTPPTGDGTSPTRTTDAQTDGLGGDLSEAIYQKLRLLARSQMASEAQGITLQPTALVHEVYLRLQNDPVLTWADDRAFYAAAAECMRRVLVDEARRRKAVKRGGGRPRVQLPDVEQPAVGGEGSDAESVLSLDAALDRLRQLDTQLYDVVMLRYFAGLSVTNTASLLGVAPRTVKRHWGAARTWLRESIAACGAGS
ncbi:MAG: ECF-type sigma factor [Planctomycetota bacterium]